MNKHIFFTLFVVIVVAFAVSAVSSEETVTIDDVNFTLPDGFTEDITEEIVDNVTQQGSITYTVNGKVFEKGSTIIVILVSDYGEYKVTDEIVSSVGGDAKTIGNQNGYIKEDSGFTVFSFEKDDKLVAMSTNDENIIEDFLAE